MKRDRGFVDQHKVGCSKRFVFSDMSLILFSSKLNLAANSVYYFKENDEHSQYQAKTNPLYIAGEHLQ